MLYTRTQVLAESGESLADSGRFLHSSGAKVSISPISNERTDSYKALEEGKADVGIGFTTDGQIASQDLVVMEDPKNIWPFYYPAPVINTDYLQAHPDVEGILNAVSAKLDAATMQRLNATVDIDQEEPAEVAEKFLTDNGLK